MWGRDETVHPAFRTELPSITPGHRLHGILCDCCPLELCNWTSGDWMSRKDRRTEWNTGKGAFSSAQIRTFYRELKILSSSKEFPFMYLWKKWSKNVQLLFKARHVFPTLDNKGVSLEAHTETVFHLTYRVYPKAPPSEWFLRVSGHGLSYRDFRFLLNLCMLTQWHIPRYGKKEQCN